MNIGTCHICGFGVEKKSFVRHQNGHLYHPKCYEDSRPKITVQGTPLTRRGELFRHLVDKIKKNIKHKNFAKGGIIKTDFTFGEKGPTLPDGITFNPDTGRIRMRKGNRTMYRSVSEGDDLMIIDAQGGKTRYHITRGKNGKLRLVPATNYESQQ